MSGSWIAKLGAVAIPIAAGLTAWTAASPSTPSQDRFGVTMPGVGEMVGERPVLQGRVPPGNSASVEISVYSQRGGSAAVISRSVTVHGSTWAWRVTLAPGQYTLRVQQQAAQHAPLRWARTFSVEQDPVIAAAGDIACDPTSVSFHGGAGSPSGRNCQERATSDLLLGANLAGVLTLGDEQYNTAQGSAFVRSFGPTWGRLGRLLHPTPGNHEFMPPNPAAGYFDYFDGAGRVNGIAGRRGLGWHSFTIGSWHFIALNSNCRYIGGCGPGSAELKWLQADLRAHPARCTLAYWHHPRFSSGRHGDDTQMTPIWQALEDGGADVVLVGHDHDYERFAPQTAGGDRNYVRGIREFVVGTGGRSHDPFISPQPNSERRNATTYGVLELVLHASSYDWRFVPVFGRRFTDSGSSPCH